MTIISICSCLYFTGKLLDNYFNLNNFRSDNIFYNIKININLPFELFNSNSNNQKHKAFSFIGLIFSFGLPILIFGLLIYATLMPKKRELHGSARFANKNELIKSGLLQPDKTDDKYPSIVVGKVNKEFLLFRGQQFMFLAAPTRSGKGVGIVIPNLLHYRDSVVVLDIKGENFDITSGFRAKCGQEVYKFAPDDEDLNTSCWNPLDYVRTDYMFRLKDLMNISNILYPPSTEDVWNSTAEKLFLGLSLYCLETKSEQKRFNIANIKRLRTSLDFLKDEKSFITYVESRKNLNSSLSEECIAHLKDYATSKDNLKGSIGISFDQPLGVFADPITAMATSKSDFDLRNVRRKRISIYVVIKPANIDKFSNFLNLFFQQLLTLNMDKMPQDDPSLKCQCLLLDEFPAMGRIGIIEKASAYMAGYNMRLLLVFQSKSQVEDRRLYDVTGARTMLTNMALQLMFAPHDEKDAKEYSEMIGYMTEKGLSKSKSMGRGPTSRGENVSDQRRAVLLPQEIKSIGIDKAIISMENMFPALVDKIFWYKEEVFKVRANLPTPKINKLEFDYSLNRTLNKESLDISNLKKNENLNLALKSTISRNIEFMVGFSPDRNAKQVVIKFIETAKKELLIAAYSFTNIDIAESLAKAQKRGVEIQIILDAEQNKEDNNNYQVIDKLKDSNIKFSRNKDFSAMHHKFMVADGVSVQLGSFNYTNSGEN